MQVEFTSVIDRWTAPEGDAAPTVLGDLRDALTHARLLERHNFDRLVVANSQDRGDSNLLGSLIIHNTASLSVAISHRAGVAAPAVAAEQLATLDQLAAGRLAVRILDASDAKSGAAAPVLDHEASLARTDEYLVLLKRLWANRAPFDHEGPFYSVAQGSVSARPFAETGIPFTLGGVSGTALKIAARHADVFSLPSGDADDVRQTIGRVQAAAQAVGRAGKIRFSLDIVPEIAAEQTGISGETAETCAHSGTVLAGTPEQIAADILRFSELGVSEFVVFGLETPDDIAGFGDRIIPLVRRSVDRGRAAAAHYFLSGGGTPYARSAS